MGKQVGEFVVDGVTLTVHRSTRGWFTVRAEAKGQVQIANGKTITEVLQGLGDVRGLSHDVVRTYLEAALSKDLN